MSSWLARRVEPVAERVLDAAADGAARMPCRHRVDRAQPSRVGTAVVVGEDDVARRAPPRAGVARRGGSGVRLLDQPHVERAPRRARRPRAAGRRCRRPRRRPRSARARASCAASAARQRASASAPLEGRDDHAERGRSVLIARSLGLCAHRRRRGHAARTRRRSSASSSPSATNATDDQRAEERELQRRAAPPPPVGRRVASQYAGPAISAAREQRGVRVHAPQPVHERDRREPSRGAAAAVTIAAPTAPKRGISSEVAARAAASTARPSTETTRCASIAVTMETETDITTSATPPANSSASSSPSRRTTAPKTTRTSSVRRAGDERRERDERRSTRGARRARRVARRLRRRRGAAGRAWRAAAAPIASANRPGVTARFCAAAYRPASARDAAQRGQREEIDLGEQLHRDAVEHERRGDAPQHARAIMVERPRSGDAARATARRAARRAVAPTLPTTAPMTEPVDPHERDDERETRQPAREAHRGDLAEPPAPGEHVAVRAREVEQEQVDREHARDTARAPARRAGGRTGSRRRSTARNASRTDDEPPAQHAGGDGAPVVGLADELHRGAREERRGRVGEPGDERRGDGEEAVARRPQRSREHGRRDQSGREQHELGGEAEHDAVGEAEVRRGGGSRRRHADRRRGSCPAAMKSSTIARTASSSEACGA